LGKDTLIRQSFFCVAVRFQQERQIKRSKCPMIAHGGRNFPLELTKLRAGYQQAG
jgi:hypothetical protein